MDDWNETVFLVFNSPECEETPPASIAARRRHRTDEREQGPRLQHRWRIGKPARARGQRHLHHQDHGRRRRAARRTALRRRQAHPRPQRSRK